MLGQEIKTVKMVVIPQFNHISMVLPLIQLDKILKQTNQTVKDYLWTEKEAEDKLSESVHRWGKGEDWHSQI